MNIRGFLKKELESSWTTPGLKNGQKGLKMHITLFQLLYFNLKRCLYGLNLRQKIHRLEQIISDSCLREPQIVLILNSDLNHFSFILRHFIYYLKMGN